MAASPSSRQSIPPEEEALVEPIRWIRGAVPVAALALVGAGVLARPPLLEAADPPWDPPPCPVAGAPSGAGAWFRLDGLVDDAGTLNGQRLTVGQLGAGGRTIDLPPESFATGPWAGRVLVGADDGARSRLSLVDIGAGCAIPIAEEDDVVRAALVTADGSAVVEHRVDRATRADLGVWRVPLEGGRGLRLVAGLATDARYGRTFSTELRWAPDGRLAITACGELRCRTRLLDMGSGRSTSIGPTGPVIGVTSDGAVVAHEACGGFPCAIVRRAEGKDATVIVRGAGTATMAGDRVVFEQAPGRLTALDARSGRFNAIADGDGLAPVATGSGARAGASHAADSALLVLGERLDGRSSRILAAGASAPVDSAEAVR
jgi:hypothetical protein